MYVASLSQYQTPSVASSAVAAISWFHKIHNLPDPGTNFYVKRALKGIQPYQSSKVELSPLDRNLLHAILRLLPQVIADNYTSIMLKALFLTMYHACLRAGEAVVSGHSKHSLHIRNVTVHTGEKPSVTFKLLSSKTSKKEKVFTMLSDPQSEFCPVDAMFAYLRQRPNKDGLLFLDYLGEPVPRTFLAENLKKLIARTGNNPDRFNTHSFRSGRATDLAKAGVPEAIIKETGRWSSDAYLKYVRFAAFALPR